MRLPLLFVVALLAVGCTRPDAQRTTQASAQASAPSLPPSAAPPPTPSPTASTPRRPVEGKITGAYRLDVPSGAKPLLLLEDDRWLVVDDKTSEWGTWRRDGATFRANAPPSPIAVVLAGTPSDGFIQLTFGNAAPVRVKATPSPTPSSVPQPAPAAAPTPRQLGGTRVRSTAPALDGCTVTGTMPELTPPLSAATAAFTEVVRTGCASAGPTGSVSIDYDTQLLGRTIVLGGDDVDMGRDSRTVFAINQRVRVTNDDGCFVSYAAHLIDAGHATVSAISGLHAEGGRALLERRAKADGAPFLAVLPKDAEADALTRASEQIGPSTIDLVVPPWPYGLWMSRRRIALGPRSELAPSYTVTPATRVLFQPRVVDM